MLFKHWFGDNSYYFWQIENAFSFIEILKAFVISVTTKSYFLVMSPKWLLDVVKTVVRCRQRLSHVRKMVIRCRQNGFQILSKWLSNIVRYITLGE